LRDKYRILIGGAQTDRQVCDYVGADGFATDVVYGVNLCKQWMGMD
jgi:methanogenic corrinoid protein MtbC1